MQALAEGDREWELRCYWMIYSIIYGNLTKTVKEITFLVVMHMQTSINYEIFS